MKVTVKILKGGECSPEVKENDSVRHLKELVASALNVEVSKQRLVFRGKTLPDDKTLAECNVTVGSKIFLMVIKSEASEESSSQPKPVPDFWTELNRFLLKHFTPRDAQLVLEKCRETFELNMASLSLDDIERLAISNLTEAAAH